MRWGKTRGNYMKEINGVELVRKIEKREKLTIIDVRERFEVAIE